MGIDFGFACGACGAEVMVHDDTSKVGPVELRCSVCGQCVGGVGDRVHFSGGTPAELGEGRPWVVRAGQGG